jgi:hypothetical protein
MQRSLWSLSRALRTLGDEKVAHTGEKIAVVCIWDLASLLQLTYDNCWVYTK